MGMVVVLELLLRLTDVPGVLWGSTPLRPTFIEKRYSMAYVPNTGALVAIRLQRQRTERCNRAQVYKHSEDCPLVPLEEVLEDMTQGDPLGDIAKEYHRKHYMPL